MNISVKTITSKIKNILDMNIFNIVIALILGILIGVHALCSCIEKKEGMSTLRPANIGFSMNDGVHTINWDDNTFTSLDFKNIAKNPFSGLKNTQAGEVPLPEGVLNFFYNNVFSGNCCNQPHSYTTSSGCACFSSDQMRYLNNRGGNNL